MNSSSLTAPHLHTFFMQHEESNFSKGEIIIHPNSDCEYVYYIQSGLVKSYTLTLHGDEQVQLLYTTHELFPLKCILPNAVNRLYYESVRELVTHRVQKDLFVSYLHSNVAYSFELLEYALIRLDMYTQRIENLEYTFSYQRVVARLLYLAKRFGTRTESADQTECSIEANHSEIANATNTTRETTTRELSKLQKKGLITVQRNTILIHNVSQLESELPM